MAGKQRTSFGWLIVMGIIIVVIWAGGAALVYFGIPEWNNRGTFGDMFGAINALFSGLAFAGILFALHLQRHELVIQREELQAQREELKLTRSELKRTAKAQENTSESLALQLETMRTTAKLNALSSLVEVYGLKISNTANSRLCDEFEKTRLQYVDQMEQVFEKLCEVKGE